MEKVLLRYLNQLRLLYVIYQNFHWQCKGLTFYSNHLLFQRLYEDVQGQVDESAEKFQGLFQLNIQLEEFIQHLTDVNELIFTSKSVPLDFFKHAIVLEKELLQLNQDIYKELNSKMSKGLDNMLAAHADSAENRLYLLNSSLS